MDVAQATEAECGLGDSRHLWPEVCGGGAAGGRVQTCKVPWTQCPVALKDQELQL